MASDGETRRLAAIMASDVVGYTALMGTDEAGTLSALRTLRKDLWEPKVAEHGGRIVKLTGDGQLTEFPSVADAVQCAVEIQRAMARRNAEIPDSHRIVLRVGINLGDVIIEGEDIYGDGVNVAARLESIAPPGGIAISRAVRDQIRDKLLYALEDMGEQELKGVARPVRVFRVSIEETGDGVGARTSAPPPAKAPPAAAAPAPTNRLWQGIAGAAVAAALVAIYVVTIWQPWVTRVEAANVANMAFPLPDKPSIVVLPFDNLSGDPDQEFLADGFSEDLTTALSRLPGIFVISRTTAQTYKGQQVTVRQIAEEVGVQYVLEGSVQREGDDLRINAQLIDALSGRHIWAEKFDGDVKDLFAVRDEITLNVVSSVGAELASGEFARVTRRKTGNLEAWLLFREALAVHAEFTRESLPLAQQMYGRVIAMDPIFVPARAGLADTYRALAQFGFVESRKEALDRGIEIINEARTMDPDEPIVFSILSSIHLAKREFVKAIEMSERAVALDPNSYLNQAVLAYDLIAVGRADDAIFRVTQAQRLSPVHPDWIENVLGYAYFLSGDLVRALATFQAVLDRNLPPGRQAIALPRMALVLAAMEREEDARDAIARPLELNPRMSIAQQLGRFPVEDATKRASLVTTWRRLGLPE